MNKPLLHKTLLDALQAKHRELAALMDEFKQASNSETKSSAGDKHETSRSMAQLEQEKLGRSMLENERLIQLAESIDPSKESQTIAVGSYIETNMGNYYLSVAFGALRVENNDIYCLSPVAPLAQLLLGKKQGDSVNWNGKKIEILAV